MLTRRHADQIARKLRAEIRHKKAHDIAVVYVDGQRVAQFGIRRGSRKDQGHDHIPNDLHVAARTCLDLARCPVSRDDWTAALRRKGLIDDPQQ